MKYLGTLQNTDGKNVDVDDHQHTKSEITDMPNKLSDFENDIGAGSGQSFRRVQGLSLQPGQDRQYRIPKQSAIQM